MLPRSGPGISRCGARSARRGNASRKSTKSGKPFHSVPAGTPACGTAFRRRHPGAMNGNASANPTQWAELPVLVFVKPSYEHDARRMRPGITTGEGYSEKANEISEESPFCPRGDRRSGAADRQGGSGASLRFPAPYSGRGGARAAGTSRMPPCRGIPPGTPAAFGWVRAFPLSCGENRVRGAVRDWPDRPRGQVAPRGDGSWDSRFGAERRPIRSRFAAPLSGVSRKRQ